MHSYSKGKTCYLALVKKNICNYYIKKENCQANDKGFSVQFWNKKRIENETSSSKGAF